MKNNGTMKRMRMFSVLTSSRLYTLLTILFIKRMRTLLAQSLLFSLTLCLLFPSRSFAQDDRPLPASLDKLLPTCDTLLAVNTPLDTVPVPAYRLPSLFKDCAPNVLTDTSDALAAFWEKLRLARAGVPGDSIRVLHVGDSHVRGHFFPTATGNLLRLAFGRVAYTDMGINGAYCLTFARDDRIAAIAAARPDLLILSFGTNESHNRSYDRVTHTHQMEELLGMIRRRLPDVPIVMTTPPGSFESVRQKNRRRTYTANARTPRVSENICRFAEAHGLAVWNLNQIAGGSSAPLNWQAARLMRPDHIHFLAQGYQLQGELFYQALVKAYNESITSPLGQAGGGGDR